MKQRWSMILFAAGAGAVLACAIVGAVLAADATDIPEEVLREGVRTSLLETGKVSGPEADFLASRLKCRFREREHERIRIDGRAAQQVLFEVILSAPECGSSADGIALAALWGRVAEGQADRLCFSVEATYFEEAGSLRSDITGTERLQ